MHSMMHISSRDFNRDLNFKDCYCKLDEYYCNILAQHLFVIPCVPTHMLFKETDSNRKPYNNVLVCILRTLDAWMF